jgi:hypothetical protein
MIVEALDRGDAELPGEAEEECLDAASFDYFVRRWADAGVRVDDDVLGGSPGCVIESLIARGLLMREGGRILSLPINCFRLVHREVLGRDQRALLAYLTLPVEAPTQPAPLGPTSAIQSPLGA